MNTIYRDRIKNILLTRGESLLDDEGIDERVAEEIADEIIAALFPFGGAL